MPRTLRYIFNTLTAVSLVLLMGVAGLWVGVWNLDMEVLGKDEEKYAAFLERSKTTHPMGRVGKAEELAALITFLTSDEAGWITGDTVNIDGGRHLTCAR